MERMMLSIKALDRSKKGRKTRREEGRGRGTRQKQGVELKVDVAC